MADPLTPDLFAPVSARPGSLGCAVEIAATIAEALERARAAGLDRDAVAARMSHHLGERMSVNMLNAYAAQSHEAHEISLRRAMALDAALDGDTLLGLYAAKRGGRLVIDADDAALLEWARLHHQERDLAERRRALEAAIQARRRG